MESLHVETLKHIEQMAVKSAGAKGKAEMLALPAEPPHVYATVDAAGVITKHTAEPQSRDHVVMTLDQLINFARTKGDTGKTAVWYDDTEIVVVLDDTTRRDFATLSLVHTPQFGKLRELYEGVSAMSQRAFRRMLKHDLAGCLTNGRLLEWIENVRWNSTANTAGQAKSARESMGRDLDEQVLSDAGEFPEDVRLKVRVYEDPGLRDTWPVDCLAEIVFSDQAFNLMPLPMQLQEAVDSELSIIDGILREALPSFAIFRGKP